MIGRMLNTLNKENFYQYQNKNDLIGFDVTDLKNSKNN